MEGYIKVKFAQFNNKAREGHSITTLHWVNHPCGGKSILDTSHRKNLELKRKMRIRTQNIKAITG